MTRLRRFRVESLQGLNTGDTVPLPAEEARHVRVLRLAAGTQIEVFDGTGRAAPASLTAAPTGLAAELSAPCVLPAAARRLVLATAWPKGKRAAWLVEKCSELGVSSIIPVRYTRSVVHKADASESVSRLRRIAAEAAKQCGRSDVPEIATQLPFAQLLAEDAPRAFTVLLDARAELHLADVLARQQTSLRQQAVLLIVGPEGGLTPEELAAAGALGLTRARLARHILRVETAALAACAVGQTFLSAAVAAGALLDSGPTGMSGLLRG